MDNASDNRKSATLRPVHTRQQMVARNGNIVAAPVKVAVSGNKLLPEIGNKVAVFGNNLLPFSATLLPGVDCGQAFSNLNNSVSERVLNDLSQQKLII